MSNNTGCPSTNARIVAQEGFWDANNSHWSTHRIGWAIAGGCTVLTVVITMYSVMRHALNYRLPAEQRQIIRILYMPPVFAIISFFSYRYFRDYIYYSVTVVAYEAIVVAAYMMLLIESFASTTYSTPGQDALRRKDKQKLPLPFCCWRYRPTKPYFMYMMKWSVMQYTIIQPIISFISVITQSFNLLCVSSFSPQFANLYLSIFSLLSNTIAVYGLVIFYELTKNDLKGKRPGAKFWCVNIIVTVPFVQQLVFSIIQGAGVLTGSKFWTPTNVADGLNALTTCGEMIFFSLFMIWAFPISEYENLQKPRQHGCSAIWDSINMSDFAVETWYSIKFFVDYIRDQPGARSHTAKQKSGYAGDTKFFEAFIGWSKLRRERWKDMSFQHSHGSSMEELDKSTKQGWNSLPYVTHIQLQPSGDEDLELFIPDKKISRFGQGTV